MGFVELAGKAHKKASSPTAVLTTIATMAVTMIWGGQYVIADMKSNTEKADTALTTVKAIEGKIDLLIQMQMIQMQANKTAIPLPVLRASQNPRRFSLDSLPADSTLVDTLEDSL